MNQYMQKPITVNAIQYTENNIDDILNWCEGQIEFKNIASDNVMIITKDGKAVSLSIGDYIYIDIDNEFYGKNQNIFEQQYELVAD